MIGHVRGEVRKVDAHNVVVDVGGIGLRISATPATIAALTPGQTHEVATSLVVREDSWTLFGFETVDERDVFDVVQSVTGVGPRTAMALVGTLGAEGLRRAVAAEDEKALMTAPGVGKKGAQRLLLELRDRIGAPTGIPAGGGAGAQGPSVDLTIRDSVAAGLTSLGWTDREADAAIAAVAASSPHLLAAGPVAVALRAAMAELRR